MGKKNKTFPTIPPISIYYVWRVEATNVCVMGYKPTASLLPNTDSRTRSGPVVCHMLLCVQSAAHDPGS